MGMVVKFGITWVGNKSAFSRQQFFFCVTFMFDYLIKFNCLHWMGFGNFHAEEVIRTFVCVEFSFVSISSQGLFSCLAALFVKECSFRNPSYFMTRDCYISVNIYISAVIYVILSSRDSKGIDHDWGCSYPLVINPWGRLDEGCIKKKRRGNRRNGMTMDRVRIRCCRSQGNLHGFGSGFWLDECLVCFSSPRPVIGFWATLLYFSCFARTDGWLGARGNYSCIRFPPFWGSHSVAGLRAGFLRANLD